MNPVRILLTEAAGEIACAVAPMIASGMILGSDQPIILHLTDMSSSIGAEYVLDSLKYELMDASFRLLKVPPTKEIDTVSSNVQTYTSIGLALNRFAHKDCKIVVVGSSVNTNAFVLQRYAEKIKPQNITTTTRLDHDRAIVQVSEKLKKDNIVSDDVKNVIIWGTHSPTFQYIDITHATAIRNRQKVAISRLLANDLQWYILLGWWLSFQMQPYLN